MTQRTKNEPPLGRPDGEPELSPYQREIRQRLLAAPVVPAPDPWRRIACAPVGGLLGIGFATHPGDGRDLVMVVSGDGHGLFDAVTGERIARDRDPDPADETPDATADLTCPGLGPVGGRRVHIAGLFGGGLHATTGDGWTVKVVAPAWPHDRVLLSRGSGFPTPARTASAGGTSSTPTTPNSAPPAFPPPAAPSPSRRAATCPCGPEARTPDDSGRPRGGNGPLVRRP